MTLDIMLKLPADALDSPRKLKKSVSDTFKAQDIGEFFLNGDELVTASHDIAIKAFADLPTAWATRDKDGKELTPAIFDGPHLMVRILDHLSPNAKVAWNKVKDSLPAGVSIVANPGTVAWA